MSALAPAVGEKIRIEDGIGNAVIEIEKIIGGA
jgi:hypothetical protein